MVTTETRPSSVVHVGIVVDQRGLVLMVRRAKTEVAGDGAELVWVFPGGKLEEGETADQCVEREIRQETGYRAYSIYTFGNRVHPEFGVDIIYHVCGLISHRRVQRPRTTEVLEVSWVSPERVEHLATTDLSPHVSSLLQKIRRPHVSQEAS